MWDREKIFFSAGTLFKEFSLFKKKQEKKENSHYYALL